MNESTIINGETVLECKEARLDFNTQSNQNDRKRGTDQLRTSTTLLLLKLLNLTPNPCDHVEKFSLLIDALSVVVSIEFAIDDDEREMRKEYYQNLFRDSTLSHLKSLLNARRAVSITGIAGVEAKVKL